MIKRRGHRLARQVLASGPIFRIIAIVLPILAIAALFAGCSTGYVPQQGDVAAAPLPSPSKSGPTNGLVQSSDGGAVTIDVKWLGGKDSLTFDVSMNTHSVDLDQYDLGKLAMLRDDQGNEYRPSSWSAPSGGHHRSGKLTFALPGSPSQTKFIELVIRNIAGVKERVLRWELG